MKKFMLVIDPQNDFLDIPDDQLQKNADGSLLKPALPVTGAADDMNRLAKFVEKNAKFFERMYVTLDSHHGVHIAHPCWWRKSDGTPANPFSVITTDGIQSGEFTPSISPDYSKKYIKDLEDQGEFPHIIWPPHCLIASWGHNVYTPLFNALQTWHLQHKTAINFVTKGSHQATEHFGALRANIPFPNDSSTQLNVAFIQSLTECDELYLAGEARDYCVANTLNQMIQDCPDLVKKMVILTDAMSNVGGDAAHFAKVDAIFDKAKQLGCRFATTNDIV